MGFLHHVGQVVAVVARECGTEDDKVKGIGLQRLLDCLAAFGGGDRVTGFLHGSGLRGEHVGIAFGIENLQLYRGFRHR